MASAKKLIRNLRDRLLFHEMNVLELWKATRHLIKTLFDEFEKSGYDKKNLVDSMVRQLGLTTLVEEQVIYPLIQSKNEESFNKALQEHHVIRLLLAELTDVTSIDATISAKVKTLRELVMEHFSTEEHQITHMVRASKCNLTELATSFQNSRANLKTTEIEPEKLAVKSPDVIVNSRGRGKAQASETSRTRRAAPGTGGRKVGGKSAQVGSNQDKHRARNAG